MSWLCTTDEEVQRYFDLDANMNLARRRVVGVLVVPGIVLVAQFGLPLWIACGSALVLAGLIEWHRRSRPPTPALGAGTVVSFQLLITVIVTLSGGLSSPMLPWLAIPVMMLACRFRRTVVLVGTTVAMVLAAAACRVAGWLETAQEVRPVFYGVSAAALSIAVSIVALTMQAAEIESRSFANQDPLTGLLNRKALAETLRHLSARARSSGQWLCVLTCDLDHFKVVNDDHGHHRGDAVLVETAQRLRMSLRDDGTVFRVGGEEFVVVLPGVDTVAGSRIAERLRRVISDHPVSGLTVTMSVGIAAGRGGDVDTGALLIDADVALYAAKRGGRNMVRAA
jgi:diguanylate cyclase (GGDEF)-like protein